MASSSKSKKICNYADEKMAEAVRAVSHGMPKKTAAKTFGVPRSTLADKISGRYRESKKIGRDPFLSQAEERNIVT